MMSLICSVSNVDMEEVMYTIEMIKREIKMQPDVDPLENVAEQFIQVVDAAQCSTGNGRRSR